MGDGDVRMLLRAPLDARAGLSASLVAMKAVRSARKEPATVQVRVDPPDPAR
jgi:primosomal protein N' (replication factor Y)